MISQIKKALKNLNPEDVRTLAARRPTIGLVAPTFEGLWRMESFFCPFSLPAGKRAEVARLLHRISAGERHGVCDIEVWDDSLAVPDYAFSFDPDAPERTIEAVLKRRADLALPLARFIPSFRKAAINHFISSVARENALFSLTTALPGIIPSVLTLPWAVGEFASDTAFLTGNQIRMTFLIAAASDHEVGYREQKAQIGSIVASAFGFRALARELVGKVPFGGGLLPKAAVSYAGTYVLGRSMERFYNLGFAFTREERHRIFEQALTKGREVAGSLLAAFKSTPAIHEP